MAVNIPVADQAEQVQGLSGSERFPYVCLEGRTTRNGGIYELGALVKDASGTHGVVTDLAVAHVVVCGQANRNAVRSEGSVWVVR